ncbi:MAG: hypothetical protein K9K67_12280 [Bacteriovoracaceae bacterium]|nr:hypothetical protein [Bacteriovoracaceae bacterium]
MQGRPIIEDTDLDQSLVDSVIKVDHDLEFTPMKSKHSNGAPPDDRFKVEINLGLALPFKYYLTDDYDKTEEHKAIVRSVDDSGSVYMLEVTTQSNEGPLQAFENDVLLVLLTMAWEQRNRNQNSRDKMNGFRVYYTLAEVCRRLGLSENSRNKVARAIRKIKSQSMQTKNFAYNAHTGQIGLLNEDTKIILKSGRVRVGATDVDFANYQDVFFVEFDSYIVKNLYDEYVSVISSDAYLALKSGPQRRVLIFLYSKKKKFGDQFLFSLEELAQVIGLTGSKKRRRQIGEYLGRIQESLKNFEFTIKKKRGQPDWDIFVTFQERNLIEAKEDRDPFYQDLVDDFGERSLRELDLTEIDIKNIRREFNFRYKKEANKEYFLYGREKLDPAEFCIDITLFQVLRSNYRITKSFKALAKVILSSMIEGGMELPEKYRHFVQKRAEDGRKKEVTEKIQTELCKKEDAKRVEMERLEKSFDKMYADMIAKNKSFKKSLEGKAKESLENEGVCPEDMMYKLTLEHRMRDLARVDFLSGDILNYKDIKSNARDSLIQ